MLALRQRWRWALATGVLLAAACGGDGTGPGTGDEPDGGGANSFAKPSGTTYHLPSGVELAGKITGETGADGQPCVAQDTLGTAAGYVNLCFTLKNTTGAPITVTIPAGTFFISVSNETQNGVQLWVYEITIPANGERTVLFSLYCANVNRHATGGGEEFTLGPTTDNAELKSLIALVASKDRDAASGIVQNALWEIGYDGKLGADMKTQIEALPNR